MHTVMSQVRRVARGIQRELWRSPERTMLHRLEREFQRKPRYTAGSVAVGPYRIEYADACSVWPQWEDIFLRESLAFETDVPAPRILDCGANVGIASLYFKRRHPRAQRPADGRAAQRHHPKSAQEGHSQKLCGSQRQALTGREL